MEELEKNPYSTAAHNDELDFIFNQDCDDLNEIIFDNKSFSKTLKTYVRLARKKIFSIINRQNQEKFTNILYLTLDCPPYTTGSYREDSPLEYITEMRKQYPDKDIRVLIPIINIEKDFQTSKKLYVNIDGTSKLLEKTSITF